MHAESQTTCISERGSWTNEQYDHRLELLPFLRRFRRADRSRHQHYEQVSVLRRQRPGTKAGLGDRNDMTVTRNEWYNTEQEAIAMLKAGTNIEIVHSHTHLDMFWLRMQYEKLLRSGQIRIPIPVRQPKR